MCSGNPYNSAEYTPHRRDRMYCSEKDCEIFKGRLVVCRECPIFDSEEAKPSVEESTGELEIAE